MDQGPSTPQARDPKGVKLELRWERCSGAGPRSGGEGGRGGSPFNIKGCLAGETRPASLSLQLFGLSCGFEAHSPGNVSIYVEGGKFVLSTISSISRTLTRPRLNLFRMP